MGDWQGGGQEWSSYNQDTDWGSAGHGQVGFDNYLKSHYSGLLDAPHFDFLPTYLTGSFSI